MSASVERSKSAAAPRLTLQMRCVSRVEDEDRLGDGIEDGFGKAARWQSIGARDPGRTLA